MEIEREKAKKTAPPTDTPTEATSNGPPAQENGAELKKEAADKVHVEVHIQYICIITDAVSDNPLM